jgi:hypothetical protein
LRGSEALLAAALLTAASGCRLAEVALPPGDDVLVVEAVLRAGARRQHVLLHRSVEGRLIRGEPGARVTVSMIDGTEMEFDQVDVLECIVGHPDDWDVEDIELDASCYSHDMEPGGSIHPGQTFELRVETHDGILARGRTTVPGAFAITVPEVTLDSFGSSATCILPDTALEIVWTRSKDAWSYLASLRITNWGDELREQGVEVPAVIELTGVSVSDADTTLLFPTNLGLFQRAEYDQRLLLALQNGVPEEADATFSLLAVDRNYTNAIRGGRFNPSGNVRSSSVVGGAIGVFGSVVPIIIRSPGDSADPRPSPC